MSSFPNKEKFFQVSKKYKEDQKIRKEKLTQPENIRYLKDTSFDLFNEIFRDLQFENLEGAKIQINDYEDFYNYQLQLNSKYKSEINSFNYKNNINMNILKEIPFKATRIRTIEGEDSALTISPNGHFVRTSEIKNKSNSTLEHYLTVIGNSLIINGEYYFEIKILELGENTDMFFGIIGKNSEYLNNYDNYKNFPFCEFEDCYGFNLNNTYYDKSQREKIMITNGAIISIKVNLKKKKMYIYFNGKSLNDNCININDETSGYYPAFSLSSGKEIQVKFGGIYNLYLYFNTANQIDVKPICQYNNLENIVSCYMKIVENSLIKIINHKQISYIDSIKYFYPMINFFAEVAFNDEYIMKKYILRFMYQNHYNVKDINKLFEERYSFLYLIINNIEKSKQQNSILFLLDCLCEDIKNDSYISESNEKMMNVSIYIKLYNYFLKKNLIKEILFPNERISDFVYKKIKAQLFVIFQTIKIFGISQIDANCENITRIVRNKMRKFIDKKTYSECFSELIETLFGLKLENEPKDINKIDDLIIKIKSENKDSEENSENKTDKEKIITTGKIKKYLLSQDKSENRNNQPIFIKNRKLLVNPYRKIFLDLIMENFKNKSDLNSYNVISTIIIPLLNIYNKYYDKDNSYNYSSKNILSYLPLLGNNMNYLNCSSSKLLIHENYKKQENQLININDNIDVILYKELYEKSYNISSFLIGQFINLSSFFEEELFDFDFYLKNEEYKKMKENSDDFGINKYIGNMKKLIYLNNENNINIIKKALNSLIPFFTELLDNNFYLFLPFKVINLLKFFIKFLSYHFFLYDDDKIIKDGTTIKLIKLFTDFNLKLLYDKNTSNKFTFNVLDNIKFLYNMFLLIHQKPILPSINGFEDDLDASDNEDIKNFSYFFKDSDLEKVLKLIRLNYEKSDKDTQKYFNKFLRYFEINKYFGNYNKENILIPLILKNIDSDNTNFWFKTLIIDTFVKNKLIPKIQKIENILNKDAGEMERKEKEEILIKYFKSIVQNLRLVSCFIDKEKILEKYFNFNLDEKSAKINYEILGNNILENEEKGNFSIYYYLIDLASLIIKNLLNSKFFKFCGKINAFIKKEDFEVKSFILECFDFLKKIFLKIPKKHQELMLENEEKNNNSDVNEEKEELNEDLKNYYIYLIYNITVNDISKLRSLIQESILNIGGEFNSLTSQLRKFIISLNKIENDHNLVHKNSNKKNDSQDLNECPICLDKKSDIHISPCGHMFCFDCIKKLKDRKCPICRNNIRGIREHPEFHFVENNVNNHPIRVINHNNVFVERVEMRNIGRHLVSRIAYIRSLFN